MTDQQLEALNAAAAKLAEEIFKPTPRFTGKMGGQDLCCDCINYGIHSPWQVCRTKLAWHRACLSYNTTGIVYYKMPFGSEIDACPF